MMQRMFLLLALGLLLISGGMVVAQSSPNFGLQRFVIGSGGSAASANYKIVAVIGQQATDMAGSTHYKVSAGFLQPLRQNKIWLPVAIK